jgi:hypothetical protein
MPKIPVNPAFLPTEETPMDETLTYTSFCRAMVMSENPSEKSGLYFLKARFEITEPDEWRGKIVMDNYIPIPAEIDPDMDSKTRARIMDAGLRLGRLLASAKMAGDADGFDSEDMIGREVRFTVKNEEFNGRMLARVNNYLI